MKIVNELKYKVYISALLILFSVQNLHSMNEKEELSSKLNKAISIARTDPLQSVDLLQELEQIARERNLSTLLLDIYKGKALAVYHLGEMKKLPGIYDIIDSLLLLNSSTEKDVAYLRQRAQFLHIKEDYPKAMGILISIRDEIFNSNDTVLQITWHSQMCSLFRRLNDLEGSIDQFLKADSLNKLINNKHTRNMIVQLNGEILWDQGKHEEALEKYIKSVSFFEEVDHKNKMIILYTNIIGTAMHLGKKDIALEYSERLSNTRKEYHTENAYITSEMNRIYLFIQVEEFQKAKELAEKTIALAEEKAKDSSHAYYLLGLAYRGLDQYGKAAEAMKVAFDKSLDIGDHGDCTFYAHSIYQTFLWRGKHENALKWHETYKQYDDSVYAEENSKALAVMEARFEAATSKMKVQELNDKAKINKQKRNQLWMGLLFCIALFGGFIYYAIMKRKKDRLLQENQMRILQLEKENLAEKLEFKEKELISQVLNMTRKNALLQNLKDEVELVQKESSNVSLKSILKSIEKSIVGDKDWDIFLESFGSLHSSFITKLQDLSSELTSNEIRLASLLRMNLTSKEIANIFNISNDGVKKARYRLRKKINLDSDSNIQEFLLGL